jgi:hypothetical protein
VPTPLKGESEAKFVKRCIPVVIRDGTANDGAQGNAVCHSLFRQHQKKQRGEAFDFTGSYESGDGYLLDVFESIAEYFMYEAQRGRPPTTVQTLIMSKERFATKGSAQTWARENGFKSDDVRETTLSWRLRQRLPGAFKQTSFRVIAMTRGVQAVVGRLK